ncbi:MAG TPA: HAMP domain-containing methyl-accepting chemotaxis protein, partial [Anaeromyxobacter sp.]
LRTLRLWLSAGVALESLAVVLVVLRLSAPIRRVSARGKTPAEPAVVAAALAASRLPGAVAALLLVLGGVTTAALLATLRGQGLPSDLALAGAALGAGATLLGAMTGYALTAGATARTLEDLGPRADLGGRGTVRGKILTIALGLELVLLLLLGAAGYARSRGDGLELAGTAAVVFAAGAVLAVTGARAVTVPFRTLGRVADRIGAGELTASPPAISRDEVGHLAEDFRRMAQGLKGLVGDVQLASAGVAEAVREVAAVGARVRTGAAGQHGALATVHAAADGMDASTAEISRGMGGVSEYVAATSGAIAELAAAFDDLRARGAELERAMQGAEREVEQLAASAGEADAGAAALEAVAGRAGEALVEAKATLAALERAASDSEAHAALVAEATRRAGGVVEQTVQGIEALRAAVGDAHRRITALGRRSDDVDQVVDFIAEVAGRTNLLSLNASIIASQAGEHGKAFAVVADQIRELAAQIARSTKSIGDIIHALREDVQATSALIGRGDALADEGLQLARSSLDALGSIQRANDQARETSFAIGAAVRAQAGSAERVSGLLQAALDGSRSVGSAVQAVGRTAVGLGGVARTVRALADEVARALDEGSSRGKRHLESIARLRSLGQVVSAVEAQGAAARRVRDAVRTLSEAAGEHEAALEGLAGV